MTKHKVNQKYITLNATLSRLVELDEIIKEYKEVLREYDALIENVVVEYKKSGKVDFHIPGYVFMLTDNFAATNLIWRAASARRFEITVLKTE